MDNARFHRRKQLFVLAHQAGVFLVFLPAYLADYNCIEKLWANMKRALVDLAPECESLQEAVYTYFEQHNS
ncbi:MAG: transposase [Candidatus Bathyarchaeota archaeon]|nr:transposase [Candidatus Termitimicrobium sp.]